MKTINDWLKKLPNPYSIMALENTEKERGNGYTGNSTAPSLKAAICGAFLWVNTPEGKDFWEAIVDEIENKKP